MPIVPDDKNWTWVLERPCPDCGFEPAAVAAADVAAGLRDSARPWSGLLAHPAVATRPSDDRWSALEYACHVRDAFRVFVERVTMMLEEDDPTFENWDQDATAVADRYHEQVPATVLVELEAAADAVARQFEAVGPDDWERTGHRSDGASFTIASLGRYLLHDPVHHVWDVRTDYERLAQEPSG